MRIRLIGIRRLGFSVAMAAFEDASARRYKFSFNNTLAGECGGGN